MSVWHQNFVYKTDLMGGPTVIRCTHNCTQNSDLTLMTPEIIIQLLDGTASPKKVTTEAEITSFIARYNMVDAVSIRFGSSSTCENEERHFWLELSGISTLLLNNSAYHCGVEMRSGEYFTKGISYLHINDPPPPATTAVTTGSTTAQTTGGATTTSTTMGEVEVRVTSMQPSTTQMVQPSSSTATPGPETSSIPGSGTTSGPGPLPVTTPPPSTGETSHHTHMHHIQHAFKFYFCRRTWNHW